MNKDEIITYMYDNHVRGDYSIEQMAEDLVQPESSTTYWIGFYTPYKCDNCGHYSDDATPYCPHCGRKMKTVYDN